MAGTEPGAGGTVNVSLPRSLTEGDSQSDGCLPLPGAPMASCIEDRTMKSLATSLALVFVALFAVAPLAFSTGPTPSPQTGNAPPSSTTTVSPGQTGTAHGHTVVNGQQADGSGAEYAGSSGKAKIRKDADGTHTTCAGGFRGSISGLSAGGTVTTGTNSNPIRVSGSGGHVNIGSGAVVTMTNTSTTQNLTFSLPGGSQGTLPPGMTVTMEG